VGRDLAVERLRLEALLTAKPGAKVFTPFGPDVPIYKVLGKVFALYNAAEDAVTLKCDPHLAEILRETHEEITPGHHVERRHWIAVALDGGLDDAQVVGLIDQSYDLVCAKLTRAQRASIA